MTVTNPQDCTSLLRHTFTACSVLALLAGATGACAADPAPGAQIEVRPGDTFSAIAARHAAKGASWRSMYRPDASGLRSPDRISVGMRFELVERRQGLVPAARLAAGRRPGRRARPGLRDRARRARAGGAGDARRRRDGDRAGGGDRLRGGRGGAARRRRRQRAGHRRAAQHPGGPAEHAVRAPAQLSRARRRPERPHRGAEQLQGVLRKHDAGRLRPRRGRAALRPRGAARRQHGAAGDVRAAHQRAVRRPDRQRPGRRRATCASASSPSPTRPRWWRCTASSGCASGAGGRTRTTS